jgi:hypothetical protein
MVFLRSVPRLLVTANVVPSSPSLVSLMMEALSSSETAVLTRAIRLAISEDAILQVLVMIERILQLLITLDVLVTYLVQLMISLIIQMPSY